MTTGKKAYENNKGLGENTGNQKFFYPTMSSTLQKVHTLSLKRNTFK